MAKATKPKKKRVNLSFVSEPGHEVLIAGTFNDWEIEDKKKAKVMKEDAENAGNYNITMFLPAGEHEFKYVVDGEWVRDPNVETVKANPFGSYNMVLTVD